MKLLFTADLHIKLKHKNIPKDWQLKRYKMLIHELASVSDRSDIDMIVLGGDIFDTIPTIEELEIYFNLISVLNKPTYIFCGNHEMLSKKKSFFSYLESSTSAINSKVSILNEPTTIFNIDFIPYTHLKTFNPESFDSKVLCTHVRGEIPPHVKPEIDLTKLDRWEIVLAGDLHSYSNSQRNILYPGSPLTTSFHRKEVETGVIILDTETLEHEWCKLKIPQLIRKTVSTASDIIKTDYHHTIYEVEGNMLSLSDVSLNDELVDKKIINKQSTSTLGLTSNLTVEEELVIYWETILNLSDIEIKELLKVYHDSIKTT